MTDLSAGLRRSIRSLLRSGPFTATASITLALGLGAATAALNLADWTLRRPLDGIPDQDRLIAVWSGPRPNGLFATLGFPAWLGGEEQRRMVERFGPAGRIAGYGRVEVSVMVPGKTPRHVKMEGVTWNYFSTLGLSPQLGSLERPGGMGRETGAAVISDRLWVSLFDRRLDVIGAGITWNGRDATVIGVAPMGFQGAERLNTTDLWLPNDSLYGGTSYYQFVARLEPGVSVRQAETILKSVVGPSIQVFSGLGVATSLRTGITQFVSLLAAGSVLLLAIACANVANLLLFRGLNRRPETALHRALGASVASLVRRHVTEAALLAVPAMVIGIPLSLWLTRLLGTVRLTRWSEPFGTVPVDWGRTALAALGALAVAAAAGVIPAFVAARTEPLEAVQGMGRQRDARRLRHFFATTQVAFSLSLVVAMLLIVGTMMRLRAIDLGFEARGVLLMSVNTRDANYLPDQTRAYYQNLLDRLQRAPEIENVSLVSSPPLWGQISRYMVLMPGREEPQETRKADVSPNYFPLMRIPFIEGRTFGPTAMFGDSTATGEVVISQSVAEALFGSEGAVGRTLMVQGRPSVVVGVVGDTHWDNVEPVGSWVRDPRRLIYSPFTVRPKTNSPPHVTFLVRARGGEQQALEAMRRAALAADPLLEPWNLGRLQDQVDLSLVDRIALARMLTILAVLASVLAAVGVYGLVAYSVATGKREIGIRIAIGADPRAVARLLLGEVFLVGGAGIVVGVGGAAALSRLLASRLYGVTAVDPATYGAAAAVLLGTAVLAAMPAIVVATRVDPVSALRSE